MLSGPVHKHNGCRVWDVCPFRFDFGSEHMRNFHMLAQDTVDTVPKEDLELFFTIAQGIWNKRNDFVHNGKLNDSQSTIKGTMNLLVESRQLRLKASILKQCPPLKGV